LSSTCTSGFNNDGNHLLSTISGAGCRLSSTPHACCDVNDVQLSGQRCQTSGINDVQVSKYVFNDVKLLRSYYCLSCKVQNSEVPVVYKESFSMAA
jgi:hypothetical protein